MDALVEDDEIGKLGWRGQAFIVAEPSSALRARAAKAAALSARARREVGFDRPGQREDERRPALRGHQQRLVLGIADIAGLEQHAGRFGPAQDVEGGELVRLAAGADPARPHAAAAARPARPIPPSGRAARGRTAGRGRCRRPRSTARRRRDFRPRRSAPPRRRRRRRTANRRSRRAPAGWARCPCGPTGTGRRRAGGRSRRAAPGSDMRSSSRVSATRTRPRCASRSRSSLAKARVSSFSRTVPDTPGAPGSRPPWPGSISTIGRPGTRASRTRTSATASGSSTVSPPRPRLADQRDRVAGHRRS